MSRVDYFLLSESVIVDKSDRVTIVNTYNAVYIPKFPSLILKFALSFSVHLSKSDITGDKVKFDIVVLDPDGKRIVEIPGSGTIQKDENGKRRPVISSLDLGGIVTATKSGKYSIQLYISGSLVATRVLTVTDQPGEKLR